MGKILKQQNQINMETNSARLRLNNQIIKMKPFSDEPLISFVKKCQKHQRNNSKKYLISSNRSSSSQSSQTQTLENYKNHNQNAIDQQFDFNNGKFLKKPNITTIQQKQNNLQLQKLKQIEFKFNLQKSFKKSANIRSQSINNRINQCYTKKSQDSIIPQNIQQNEYQLYNRCKSAAMVRVPESQNCNQIQQSSYNKTGKQYIDLQNMLQQANMTSNYLNVQMNNHQNKINNLKMNINQMVKNISGQHLQSLIQSQIQSTGSNSSLKTVNNQSSQKIYSDPNNTKENNYSSYKKRLVEQQIMNQKNLIFQNTNKNQQSKQFANIIRKGKKKTFLLIKKTLENTPYSDFQVKKNKNYNQTTNIVSQNEQVQISNTNTSNILSELSSHNNIIANNFKNKIELTSNEGQYIINQNEVLQNQFDKQQSTNHEQNNPSQIEVVKQEQQESQPLQTEAQIYNANKQIQQSIEDDDLGIFTSTSPLYKGEQSIPIKQKSLQIKEHLNIKNQNVLNKYPLIAKLTTNIVAKSIKIVNNKVSDSEFKKQKQAILQTQFQPKENQWIYDEASGHTKLHSDGFNQVSLKVSVNISIFIQILSLQYYNKDESFKSRHYNHYFKLSGEFHEFKVTIPEKWEDFQKVSINSYANMNQLRENKYAMIAFYQCKIVKDKKKLKQSIAASLVYEIGKIELDLKDYLQNQGANDIAKDILDSDLQIVGNARLLVKITKNINKNAKLHEQQTI